MEIQFWWYSVWHEILYIFNTGSAWIWVWLWFGCVFYELYFLWFILYMVNWIPLHDSYGEIQLYFKLLIESVSFHKFMIVVPLILDFVFCFMLYSSLMIMWFSYSFDYIPGQFLSWFSLNYIFEKDFFKLEPLYSRFNFRDNIFWRRCRGQRNESTSSLGIQHLYISNFGGFTRSMRPIIDYINHLYQLPKQSYNGFKKDRNLRKSLITFTSESLELWTDIKRS